MNPLELAKRRYNDIVSDELIDTDPSERYWHMPTSKLIAWIENYVVPAVEEVYQRPTFRDHATWPQRVLVEGAGTPERAAVERIDQALVREAAALHRLSRNGLVARSLEEMARAPQQQSGTCSATAVSAEHLPTRFDPRQNIPYYIDQTENLSRRDWTDFVCADDYFTPTGGMMRRTPVPQGVTEGAFVTSLSPHLFQVGDSITRCMMQRIRSWRSFLAEARHVIYEAVLATGRPYTSQIEAERQAYQELEQSHADLQRLCLTGTDARIREACITLVQVYAEFHPNPDLDWLGLSDRAFQGFSGRLRHNIKSTRKLETLDRIAAASGDVIHLYRGSSPETSAIEAAITTGGLVLIDAEQEAYWKENEIDQDWHRHLKAWEMLWKLAANARTASPVNDIDLYGEPVGLSTMANRWSRLRQLLPTSLCNFVVPAGRERGHYKLTLPINEIHLFDSRGAGH